MIFSRCTRILKTVNHLKNTKNVTLNLQTVRHSSNDTYYRKMPSPTKLDVICCEIAGGFFWWWILWNFWHDHMIILQGEIPGPFPEHWTDEELGIPPE